MKKLLLMLVLCLLMSSPALAVLDADGDGYVDEASGGTDVGSLDTMISNKGILLTTGDGSSLTNLSKSQVGLTLVENIKHAYGQSIDPPVTADNTVNYEVGKSLWLKTDGSVFICTDDTTGAAVWQKLVTLKADGTMNIDLELEDNCSPTTAGLITRCSADDTIRMGDGTGTVTFSALSETAIEAIVDLQDLQGAVTDSQVPDNITITEVDPNALLTAGTDNVKDTHVDWGAGAGQVSADDIGDGSTNAIPTLTQETNWDTAHGWGDHSGAGYSTGAHTTDDQTASEVSVADAGGYFDGATVEAVLQGHGFDYSNMEFYNPKNYGAYFDGTAHVLDATYFTNNTWLYPDGVWSGGGTYVKFDIVRGSDNRVYQANAAGGEAEDPTLDTNYTYWTPLYDVGDEADYVITQYLLALYGVALMPSGEYYGDNDKGLILLRPSPILTGKGWFKYEGQTGDLSNITAMLDNDADGTMITVMDQASNIADFTVKANVTKTAGWGLVYNDQAYRADTSHYTFHGNIERVNFVELENGVDYQNNFLYMRGNHLSFRDVDGTSMHFKAAGAAGDSDFRNVVMQHSPASKIAGNSATSVGIDLEHAEQLSFDHFKIINYDRPVVFSPDSANSEKVWHTTFIEPSFEQHTDLCFSDAGNGGDNSYVTFIGGKCSNLAYTSDYAFDTTNIDYVLFDGGFSMGANGKGGHINSTGVSVLGAKLYSNDQELVNLDGTGTGTYVTDGYDLYLGASAVDTKVADSTFFGSSAVNHKGFISVNGSADTHIFTGNSLGLLNHGTPESITDTTTTGIYTDNTSAEGDVTHRTTQNSGATVFEMDAGGVSFYSDVDGNYPYITMNAYHNGTNWKGPYLIGKNWNGTKTARTALGADYTLFSFSGQGYDGDGTPDTMGNVAQIAAFSDGAFSSGSAPTRLEFNTTPSGSTAVDATPELKIDNAGLITMRTLSGSGSTAVCADNSGVLSNCAAGSGDALVANPLSQFASTNSAQLAGVISDETGTGSLVYSNSPTLVTPSLGTPSAVNLTNATNFPATITQQIAAGTSALGTSAITDGTCTTVVTTSATGTATTDVINWGFNGDPTAVTGYNPSGDLVYIVAYPTTNNVNFKVCNKSGSSITPGAITLNWRVDR